MVLHEIDNIIPSDKKFTFLVGAGISIEPPTGLKSAVEIVKSLVKICAADTEISKILSLPNLRYEIVVEFIQKYFDQELKIMDFFDNFTQPNIQHFFLAHMIKKGHQVITTNFDYLIEFALLDIIEEKSNIIPVITRRDYMNYAKPEDLIKEGKFPLFKIHGSKKNIVTNEDTRKSLVTTISALGRDRDEKTFAIEDYKKPALVNLLEDRTLIVMGYSGSDDFDISPTLKELQNYSRLIWINHISKDTPEIIRIESISESKTETNSKEGSLLEQIAHSFELLEIPIEIFKVNVNTGIFVRNILWNLLLGGLEKPKLAESSSIDFDYEKWFYEVLKPINEFRKLLFSWEVYYRLAQPDEALRIGEIGLNLAELQGNVELKSSFLNNNGLIYLDKGDPKKALEFYESSLELGGPEGSSMTLNNIGMVYKSQRDFQNAIHWLKKALEVSESSQKITEKITILNNIGLTYYAERKYQDAFEYYDKALELNQSLGDLGIKSRLLSNIGSIYFSEKDYESALDKFQEALRISEELGDLNGITVRLNNIASIYSEQGKKELALTFYEKALEKVEVLGDLAKKAVYLTNIALLYSEIDSKDKAVKLFDEALPIDKLLNDMERVLFDLKKTGVFYKDIGEYQNALARYEEALDYYEKANDLGGVSGTLNDIAMVYYNQGKLVKAIETLERAINIAIDGGYGSTPEVQDFIFGLEELKRKLTEVADLEEILKNWEENRSSQLENFLNKLNLDDLIIEINDNPYILEAFSWEIGKGQEYLKKIIDLFQIDTDEELPLIAKGFLFVFLKQFDKALSSFEKVLQINPSSLNAIVGTAIYRINKKDLESALELLKKFEHTNNYLVLYQIALAYSRKKDYNNSEDYLRRVLEIKPGFLPAINMLGTVNYYRNDFQKAHDYWQDALNVNSDYLKAYSNLGLIHYNQKQYDKAEEIYKKLLKLDINDNFTLNMLARIYFNSRQASKGEWILKRMLFLNPKNKDALQNLAGLYYNAHNYLKAEIYYKKALELDLDDLKNLEFLLNTYRGMGYTERVEEVRKRIQDIEMKQ